MNRNTGMNAGQIIGTMNGLQVIGLDIAKHVFQLHSVDMGTGEIVNVKIKRAQVLEHFVNRAACLIAIEACGGAHHWARELTAQGHSVRLLHAKIVRPFVSGNKTDATDARAIWLAVQQPGVKFVGIKTAAQQATLTLHRQRELLIELSAQLPQMVRDSLREQVARIKAMSEGMLAIEKRLGLQLKADPQMQRIAQIPGVGLLAATGDIATMGEASAFKSGREFCAWLGLVPKQTGSGGKVRLGGISKRGDTYLRTLLIHGARSVLAHAKESGPWLEQIKQRRPANVVIVAQAAKMARTIWAVTAKEQDYQRGFKSIRPNASLQAA